MERAPLADRASKASDLLAGVSVGDALRIRRGRNDGSSEARPANDNVFRELAELGVAELPLAV